MKCYNLNLGINKKNYFLSYNLFLSCVKPLTDCKVLSLLNFQQKLSSFLINKIIKLVKEGLS